MTNDDAETWDKFLNFHLDYSYSVDVTAIKDFIARAFDEVEYPSKDGIVMGEPGGDPEMEDTRRLLRGKTWQKLLEEFERMSTSDFNYFGVALSFTTPEAVACYLPAFMLHVLSGNEYNNTADDTVSTAQKILSNGRRWPSDTIVPLTEDQIKAMTLFVSYMSALESATDEHGRPYLRTGGSAMTRFAILGNAESVPNSSTRLELGGRWLPWNLASDSSYSAWEQALPIINQAIATFGFVHVYFYTDRRRVERVAQIDRVIVSKREFVSPAPSTAVAKNFRSKVWIKCSRISVLRDPIIDGDFNALSKPIGPASTRHSINTSDWDEMDSTGLVYIDDPKPTGRWKE